MTLCPPPRKPPHPELEKWLTLEQFRVWVESQIPENAKSGDPILVATNLREKSMAMHSMRGTEYDYSLTSTFYLAFLDKPPFVVLDEDRLLGGVHFSAKKYWITKRGEQRREKGALKLPFYTRDRPNLFAIDILNPLSEAITGDYLYDMWEPGEKDPATRAGYREQVRSSGVYPIEIVVGHDQIQRYLSLRKPGVLPSYFTLWREMKIPVELPDELRLEELQEREQVARRILTLWEEVFKTERQVGTIMQQCATGDGADALPKSLSARQQRSDSVKKLRSLLKRAGKLKMNKTAHQLELLIPGVVVDVPKLIEESMKILDTKPDD